MPQPHASSYPATLPPPGAKPWLIEAKATLALALPLIGAQLAQVGIQTIDIVMIGWLGPQELAAAALGSSIFFASWLFAMGICSAVAPLVAYARGSKQPRQVRRSVRQGFWVALTIGLPLSLALWQMEAILLSLGQLPGNAALAGSYIQAMLFGFVPSLWFVVMRSFLSAMDKGRIILVVSLLALGLNALCNYALMFGNFGFPRLELVGAGIASALVACFMFAGLLFYTLTHRRLKRYALMIRLWRPDWPLYREIFFIGTPIGATILMEAGMFAAAAQMMGRIGTIELAAHTISLQCVAVAFMLPLGLGQAATIRVGLADGRRQWATIGYAGWSAMALGMVCVVLTVIAFWFFPVTLVDFFLDLDLAENRAVLDYAVIYLAIAAIFQLADSGQVIASCSLRGLKDTRKPMLLAAFGYWGIGVPVALWLGFRTDLGGTGVWIGLAVGLMVTAAMLILRFALRER
ncbi:MAG: MATE family efflux transporter, partial [Rhodovibrionaceae bacterium]